MLLGILCHLNIGAFAAGVIVKAATCYLSLGVGYKDCNMGKPTKSKANEVEASASNVDSLNEDGRIAVRKQNQQTSRCA